MRRTSQNIDFARITVVTSGCIQASAVQTLEELSVLYLASFLDSLASLACEFYVVFNFRRPFQILLYTVISLEPRQC